MIKTIRVWALFLFVFLGHNLTFAESRKFNEAFKLEEEFQLQQTQKDSIINVSVLRAAKDGRIWIVDAGFPSRNVKVYSPRGNLLMVIGEKGKKNLEFGIPQSIAFDKTQKAYIAEVIGKVNVVDSVGRFLNYFATQQDSLCRVATWSIAIDPEGNVYIGGACENDCPDMKGFCLHKYDSQGKYIKSFFPFEKKIMEFTSIPPEWVYFDLDTEGNIWCIQTMVYQVFKYSPDGKLLQKITGKSALYKPPTKFDKGPLFTTSTKSQKAYDAWEKSWTQIRNIFVVPSNLILLSLHTHSPSEYVLEIIDQKGNVLATDIQTNYRLLGKDDGGFLYFLLDGEKGSREYRIGKFSLNLKP